MRDKITKKIEAAEKCKVKHCPTQLEASNKVNDKMKQQMSKLVLQVKEKKLSRENFMKKISVLTNKSKQAKEHKELQKCTADECAKEIKSMMKAYLKTFNKQCKNQECSEDVKNLDELLKSNKALMTKMTEFNQIIMKLYKSDK